MHLFRSASHSTHYIVYSPVTPTFEAYDPHEALHLCSLYCHLASINICYVSVMYVSYGWLEHGCLNTDTADVFCYVAVAWQSNVCVKTRC